jgi:hypothetical protein
LIDDFRIECVRGRAADHAESLEAFWAERGGPVGNAARRRLDEVVCLLLDGRGSVVGVNSVYADQVAPIGGRTFWIYRSLLDPASDRAVDAAMIDAAHAALAEEFAAGDGNGPIGLCVLVADPDTIRHRPETVWPGAGLIYAGYTKDERQIRLGYFKGARV